MAERRTITSATEAEGLGMGDRLEECRQIAAFLKVAVSSMLAAASGEAGLPSGEDMDRVILGYERCSDLLLDHLDALEARHG